VKAVARELICGDIVADLAAGCAFPQQIPDEVPEVVLGSGDLGASMQERHQFDVTGLDLDPAMIARARANADHPSNSDQRRPSLLVGNVAATGRTHAQLSASGGEGHAMAMALEVQPHPADRARPRRWVARVFGP
jgi:SAM-dependent methyltransferase